MTTLDILEKWADHVKLENYISDYCCMWRCSIGDTTAEATTIEDAVELADAKVEERNSLL